MSSGAVGWFGLPDGTIEVSTDDPTLLGWLQVRVPSAPPDLDGSRRFAISQRGERWVLVEDGVETGPARSRRAVAVRLLERLNQLACFANPRVSIHSGLVADETGRGIWIPASSGGGKTTLTAQMAMSGLRYSTDEVVSLQDDGRLLGWTKWLSVKPGSHQTLRALAPEHADIVRHDGGWMVPPARVGSCISGPVAPAVVAFPDHRPGAPTSVERISRAAALARVAPEVFNLRDQGRRGLEALADVLRHAEACVRISYGDGWDAARTLGALLASEGPRLD